MAAAPLRLKLELARASDPIEGRLSDEHGKRFPFSGWLELIALLEAAKAEDGRPPTREGPSTTGK